MTTFSTKPKQTQSLFTPHSILPPMELFDKIKELLDQHQITYEVKKHAPTPTSEDSARERGEPIKIGAKAMVMKADDAFILVILPADKRIDSKKVKDIFHVKNLRFATPEELKEKTGCEKGAVPPFGDLLHLSMIVDQAIFQEEYLAFNAGSLQHSIKMKTSDYQKIVQPKIESFSQ